jgi:phospholipid/cholesterol/gamma-HCH transport system permease protein
MITWLGRRVLEGLNYAWAIWKLIVDAVRNVLRPEQRGGRAALQVIVRQVLFTGVDALPVTSVIALLLGMIIIMQAGTQLPKLGASGLLGNIIVLTVIRELGPLITAVIVIGRSGAAITTELGNMSVGREITALTLMGIPVGRFLVMPRVIGMVIALICLTLYFDAVAVLGGFMFAQLKLTVPIDAFIQGVTRALSFRDVGLTALKSLSFGLAVAAICCYHGLAVRSSYTEVPQQTTKAMINAVTMCLLLDIIISLPVYLI